MKVADDSIDFTLINCLKSGDHKAFDIIFKKYYPILCAYAYRFVELNDAEEIVQEIMIWLWENRTNLPIEVSLRQYLFKMTYHRSLNLISKKEIAARAEKSFSEKSLEWFEDINSIQIQELVQRIETAIEQLPETYRTAFIIHRFKGMSYKEIAEMYQVSPKTIDYRIQQALKILRKELKDYLPFGLILTKILYKTT